RDTGVAEHLRDIDRRQVHAGEEVTHHPVAAEGPKTRKNPLAKLKHADTLAHFDGFFNAQRFYRGGPRRNRRAPRAGRRSSVRRPDTCPARISSPRGYAMRRRAFEWPVN